ncbi:MAG: hypothetical protein ACHQM6_11170 [Candidatus Kapaibacterium sp.]
MIVSFFQLTMFFVVHIVIVIRMVRSLLICCLIGMLLASCTKNSNPASSATVADSLRFPVHALFEKNGVSSLNGWVYNPAIAGDTANFDVDVPPGDGTWSLKLHKADTPHGSNNVTEVLPISQAVSMS